MSSKFTELLLRARLYPESRRRVPRTLRWISDDRLTTWNKREGTRKENAKEATNERKENKREETRRRKRLGNDGETLPLSRIPGSARIEPPLVR